MKISGPTKKTSAFPLSDVFAFALWVAQCWEKMRDPADIILENGPIREKWIFKQALAYDALRYKSRYENTSRCCHRR